MKIAVGLIAAILMCSACRSAGSDGAAKGAAGATGGTSELTPAGTPPSAMAASTPQAGTVIAGGTPPAAGTPFPAGAGGAGGASGIAGGTPAGAASGQPLAGGSSTMTGQPSTPGAAAAPPLSVSKQRAYSVRAVSEGFGPSSTKAIGASCRNAGDLLVDHKCLTDATCGALYQSEGTPGNTPGATDVATCGARNSCAKGNITVEVVAYCLPL